MKGCGKSAPRRWQHSVARQTPPGARPNREARHQVFGSGARMAHTGFRVGRLRCAVTRIPDEWLPSTKPGLSADSPCFHKGRPASCLRGGSDWLAAICRRSPADFPPAATDHKFKFNDRGPGTRFRRSVVRVFCIGPWPVPWINPPSFAPFSPQGCANVRACCFRAWELRLSTVFFRLHFYLKKCT